jgi:hemerythrin-like domain-containing protein
MKAAPNAPADTRMMGIVHQALRRDLARARTVLLSEPAPSDAQRTALAQHLEWLMTFLHQHHAGEDGGLFPLVVQRNPSAAALVKLMDADHEAITPGIAAVKRAAVDYGLSNSADKGEQLVASIQMLEECLLPHLDREEQELMPLVAATLSMADWQAWDQQYNIKSKSFRELGHQGHFLIDGLSDSDRQVVVSLVPPIPRFILLHGFAAPYRRHLQRCWGPGHGSAARDPAVAT